MQNFSQKMNRCRNSISSKLTIGFVINISIVYSLFRFMELIMVIQELSLFCQCRTNFFFGVTSRLPLLLRLRVQLMISLAVTTGGFSNTDSTITVRSLL